MDAHDYLQREISACEAEQQGPRTKHWERFTLFCTLAKDLVSPGIVLNDKQISALERCLGEIYAESKEAPGFAFSMALQLATYINSCNRTT